MRPDTNVKTKINYIIDPGYVYIPLESKIDKPKLHNENDNHICDIFSYGHPEVMNLYFDYYTQLQCLINQYGTVNENLLYHYLLNNNIKYKLIDIDFFVILSLCNTIAITGDSGSGKTTIANILKNLFNNSFVLECDRYHKWERNNKKWENITHLNPDANYITKMTNDVFDLKMGNTVYQVDYNHSTGKFSDNEKIESTDNIIVCGLHSLYISDSILNLKIYMETDDNLRIPWKIKRDMHKRGYSIEKIMVQIENRKSDFEKYILPQKQIADIVINFYTDTVFDYKSYNINQKYDVFLRIGIKPKYNIINIISQLKIINILEENNFIYLYFNSNFHYESIIKTIICNLYLK
jgi:uridine kinase